MTQQLGQFVHCEPPLASAPKKSRPIRWFFLILLLLASIINYIDRQTLSILAVTIQRDMRLSDIQYARIVQAFLLAYMVMYVVSGRLVDRFGVRRSQGFFLVAWSAASVVTGMATGFVSFVICRASLGAAEPGNYTASLRAVGDWFSKRERAFAVGVYSMGGTLGAAVAVPLTAILATRYGWRSAFYVTGAIGAFVALLWFAFYRDPVEQHEQKRVQESFRSLLRKPYLPEMLIARMMTDSVWYFFLFWVPKFVQQRYGLTLATIGATLWLVYLSADLGSLAGGTLSGFFARTRTPIRARRLVMVPSAACMVMLAFVFRIESHVWCIALLSILTFCHMAWMTNITTLTIDLYEPHTVASMQGIIGSASAAGGLVSAGIIGYVLQFHGYSPVLLGLAFMHPLAAILLFTRLPSRSASSKMIQGVT